MISALRDASLGQPASAPDAPAWVGGYLRGKSSVDYDTGITCLDISRQMADLQIKVRNANSGVADAIAGALAAGFDLLNPGSWSSSSVYTSLMTLYDESMAAKAAANISLAIYGALFNGYNCWDWLYNGVDGTNTGGGGGDSGGGNGGVQYSCHSEYGSIEVSYDGGLTWDDVWSGYYDVCEYAE